MTRLRIPIIARLVLALLAVQVLASCSSKVKIEGEIKGLGMQSLRVVHYGPDGSVSESFVETSDNKFTYIGESDGPVLIAVYNSQGMGVVTLALEPGDKAKVSGEMLKLSELKVSGSDLSKRWREFMDKNKKLYDSSDKQRLNAAIEKYVKSHRDDILSTVLVLCDYVPASLSDTQRLLKLVDDNAKPASLIGSINALEAMNRSRSKKAARVAQMILFDGRDDDYAPVRLSGKARWVLYFWSKENQQQRVAHFNILKQLEQSSDEVQIADILMDNDTTGWHNITQREGGSQWRHLWAPQAVMNPSIRDLAIETLPTVVVADTTGTVLKRLNTLTKPDDLNVK